MDGTFTDLASDVEVPETFAPLLKQTLETLVNFTDARRRTLRSLHAQARWRCVFRDKFVLAVQAVERSAAKRTVDVTWTAHRNGFTCVSLHDPVTKMSYDHTNSDPVRAKYIVSLMKDMLQAVFHTPAFSVVDADAVIELISVLNDDIETVVDRIPDTQQPMRRAAAYWLSRAGVVSPQVWVGDRTLRQYCTHSGAEYGIDYFHADRIGVRSRGPFRMTLTFAVGLSNGPSVKRLR